MRSSREFEPQDADLPGTATPQGVAPPKPSHAAPLVATVVLGGLWLVLSIGAGTVAPAVSDLAEWIEVGLGLDVLPGAPDDDDADDGEGAR